MSLRRTAGLLVALCVSLAGCSTDTSSRAAETTGPGADTSGQGGEIEGYTFIDRPAPDTQVRKPDTCGRTRASLVVDGLSTPVSRFRAQAPVVTVGLGDTALLDVTGRCSYTAGATPQDGVVEQRWHNPGVHHGWTFNARRTGTTTLPVTMPMCAQPRWVKGQSHCLGGIATLGYIKIRVVPGR